MQILLCTKKKTQTKNKNKQTKKPCYCKINFTLRTTVKQKPDYYTCFSWDPSLCKLDRFIIPTKLKKLMCQIISETALQLFITKLPDSTAISRLVRGDTTPLLCADANEMPCTSTDT